MHIRPTSKKDPAVKQSLHTPEEYGEVSIILLF